MSSSIHWGYIFLLVALLQFDSNFHTHAQQLFSVYLSIHFVSSSNQSTKRVIFRNHAQINVSFGGKTKRQIIPPWMWRKNKKTFFFKYDTGTRIYQKFCRCKKKKQKGHKVNFKRMDKVHSTIGSAWLSVMYPGSIPISLHKMSCFNVLDILIQCVLILWINCLFYSENTKTCPNATLH